MAERRMFAKSIINSARFLKMPISTQALYFHLGCNADDDGVVEAFNISKMCGASEDDLKILVAKEFVHVLNDDLVTYITDWTIHNSIRADRKVDSIYKKLLLQLVPNVELVESKTRTDVLKKREKKELGQPMDSKWTSTGQPMDSQWTEEDRLGKDRLGKDRLGEDSRDITSNKFAYSNKFERIVTAWNSLGLSKLQSIKGNREKMLNARLREYGEESVLVAIENIKSASFLRGQNNKSWTIVFDWFIKPNNFIKVLEDNYADGTGSNNKQQEYVPSRWGNEV